MFDELKHLNVTDFQKQTNKQKKQEEDKHFCTALYVCQRLTSSRGVQRIPAMHFYPVCMQMQVQVI